jgi:hypothetical protein
VANPVWALNLVVSPPNTEPQTSAFQIFCLLAYTEASCEEEQKGLSVLLFHCGLELVDFRVRVNFLEAFPQPLPLSPQRPLFD